MNFGKIEKEERMADQHQFFFELAERTYLRFQVADVLMQCFELKNSEPLYRFIEELILPGPHPVVDLQEVLSEANRKRIELQDEMRQIIVEVNQENQGSGIKVEGLVDLLALEVMTSSQSEINPTEEQAELEGLGEGIIYPAKERNIKINKIIAEYMELFTQITVLLDIEQYLKDWLWGMAYEAFHEQYPLLHKRIKFIL